MPCVEARFSGLKLTKALSTQLETEITRTLQETIGYAFPVQLGYTEGTKEFKIAHNFARKIMPGWTWITLSEDNWAVAGKRVPDQIVARIHIFVLANAVALNFRRQVTTNVLKTVDKILSRKGKKVQLFVDIIEGEADLTLPKELFSDMLQGQPHKLLSPEEVVQFFRDAVAKEMGKR
jgi:hypothetical protein